MPRAMKTTEQFIKDLKDVNQDIEVLGKYKGSLIKILVKCKIDGYEWYSTPNNLLSGRGCPECAGNRTITHEQFVIVLSDINPDIEVLGNYKNAKSKILVKCKIDGHEWRTIPDNLLRGYGCPECDKRNRSKTHDQFLKELSEINPNIEVLGEYKNNQTRILVKCKIDGYEWYTRPINLLARNGCSECYKRNRLKTHEQFLKELSEINQDIEVLGEYKNSYTKILVKCKIDGHEWSIAPNDLLRGVGCSECYRKKLTKTHEQFIKDLSEINPNIEVLGEYKNSTTKILIRCKVCGREWSALPNNLLRDRVCVKCVRKK